MAGKRSRGWDIANYVLYMSTQMVCMVCMYQETPMLAHHNVIMLTCMTFVTKFMYVHVFIVQSLLNYTISVSVIF